MTIRLPPDQDILYPLVRILVMPSGNWTTSPQPWDILPVPARMDRTGRRYYGDRQGYELDNVEEPPCLPLIGAAVFHFDYGEINGVDYDIDDGADKTTARDLLGYDIRIQLSAPPQTTTAGSTFTPSWKTVFLGTVISQDDTPWTDDQVSATLAGGGRRTYRCADLLWRTQRWPMNRHNAVMQTAAAGSDTNPRAFIHSYGHPGYNYAVQGYYRRLMGNKWAGTWPLGNGGHPNVYSDPFGDEVSGGVQVVGTNIDQYIPHTWTGAGTSYCATWTDLAVVNHALASSRSRGEPCFVVRPGDTGGYATDILAQSTFAWPVNEGESCFDFINRILARQRARGMSRLWWTKNANGTSLGSEPAAADQPGNIYPCIAVFPQHLTDITFTPPGGSTVTYFGATNCGTTVAVDLAGDHRVPTGGIELAQNATAAVDYLESFGEPIEILVTLSPGDAATSHGTGDDGTLAKRWTAAEQTAFEAIAESNYWQRSLDRWKYVWQRWTLPATWDFKVGNGNGATRQGVNWYCDDTAALQLFDISSTSWTYDPNNRGTPSPLTCRILSDLPLYEGYDYTTNNTTRYDGITDTLSPPRLPPMVLANNGDGQFLDAVTVGAGLQNDDFGVLVTTGNDIAQGTRTFSSDDNIGNVYGAENLVLTVGLQLSHRVRVATADGSYGPTNTPRRKSLYFPGVFLWLADSYAIWRIGHISGSDASPFMDPTRAAVGGTPSAPGVIRDDRAALMSLHNLAWAWYSIEHRTARWEIRDCGLMTSFTSNDSDGNATTINYPTVGQLVTTLTCSQIYTANTPITRKVYDASRGVTTFFTDWADLDLA